MAIRPYKPKDRRPIASRERRIWKRMAAFLAARRISPNAISITGMIFGIVSGILFAATQFSHNEHIHRLLWSAAAACILIRLLANMMDGMVAVLSKRASPYGELYNELTDRVSDIAIIIGAGYAVGGWPALGYIAAGVAILTAYIRAVGNAAGVYNLFIGPMAKPQRMVILITAGALMAVVPRQWQPFWGGAGWGIVAIGLGIIIIGGSITIVRRLRLIIAYQRSRK
ncbi:MAG: CDP-alcohol phosphatidyltransferase family protein [Spirochaetota bacterium]